MRRIAFFGLDYVCDGWRLALWDAGNALRHEQRAAFPAAHDGSAKRQAMPSESKL